MGCSREQQSANVGRVSNRPIPLVSVVNGRLASGCTAHHARASLNSRAAPQGGDGCHY
jgi:hypothetical protein